MDPSVSFDQVGGLDHYINALKEMVFLPLVYPELFERFHLTPPRGVLFYGPPGDAQDRNAKVCLFYKLNMNLTQKTPYVCNVSCDGVIRG